MARKDVIGNIEYAVEILGDKWTALLLRELTNNGPLRFSDLAVAFPHLSERTLSSRLKYLYDEDVISKLPYSTHPVRYRYGLSSKGKVFVPVLREMMRVD